MKSMSQPIFKRIHVSDRKALLKQIADMRLELTCRQEERKFSLFAQSVGDGKELFCLPSGDLEVEIQGEIIINFILDEHQYFFNSPIRKDSRGYYIKADGDVFILQRRQSARLDIPKEYSALLRIMSHNGKAILHDAIIEDISAGGVKVRIPPPFPKVKSADRIVGNVHLGKKTPIEFECEVRFVSTSSEDPQAQSCGLMFLDMNKIMENRLLTILMGLQHELFTKFGSGERS